MVVEELVAKLGFKVDGLGELKKFEGGLKQAKDSVSNFGTALNKWLSGAKMGALNGASAIGGKMAAGFKSAASSIAMAAAAAARVAVGVAAFSAALVTGVALAAKLAYNFVKARGEAARMRREVQLAAEGNRSKAGSIESLQKGLDAIASSGALKDKAKEFVGQIAKEADAAIRGEGDGKYEKAKIKLLDPNGVQRDTTAVAMDVLSKYADLVKQAQIARREAAIAQSKGDKRGEVAATGRANKNELEARKFASDFGIDGPLKATIDELRNGAAQFREAMEKASKLNPGKTADEEDAAKDRAKRYEELRQKVEGIGNGLQSAVDGVKDSIADRLHGAVDDAASAILSLGKYLKIIPETKGEVEDRAKAKADASKDAPGVAAAKKAVEPVGKAEFLGWLMGFGDELTKAKVALADAARNYQIAKGTREANAGENIRPDIAASIEKAFTDAAAKLIEAFKTYKELKENNSPEGQSKKSGEKAEKKVINDNRSDFGNDQRTNHVTVNQTVNTFAEGAQQAAKAVLGAVSTKASVSTTLSSVAV